MRVLAVTKLFPNRAEPLASSFNRQQFGELARRCELRVVAPVEWFPGAKFVAPESRPGRLSVVPRRDQVAGMAVEHPRIVHVPRIGGAISGALCASSLAATVWRARHETDVILASWAYPHGVACIRLGQLLGIPVVVKVHGSDINVVAEIPGPRRQLCGHLPRASRIAAVSQPLADKVASLGVDPMKIRLTPNGVDGTLFHPRPRDASRARLGRTPDERLVLYVGWLEPNKGVFDLLDGFSQLVARDPSARLVMVGDGSARQECEARSASIPGVELVGAKPPTEVAEWMAACDLLTLPSWNEGTPNVVLEALSSGRRVVATRVGGIPDLLTGDALGEMVPAKDPTALALALGRGVSADYDPLAVTANAGTMDWAESALRLHDVLTEAAAEGPG